MKKRIWITALATTLILSGCGGNNKGSDIRVIDSNSFISTDSAPSESGGFVDYDYADDTSAAESWYPESEPAVSEEAPAGSSGSTKGSEGSGTNATSAGEIAREMLVYSCSMSIDTLDFASTINGFRTLLDQYGGFVEYENYDNGGSYSRWYSESADKWQSYNATVRVPSRNYDAFCNSAGGLGDLRSKNASVQNLSSEYNDLSTSLEIYEAKEDRYIALLADITEDEYAVAIERELTDIQIQIAAIKSRMNKINTDVTYSYVYITINEVKEYVSEPVKTDTFFDRLANTIGDTGRGFVEFLESALFLIIRLLPYLILAALLIVVLFLLTKKRRTHRRNLRQQQAACTAAQTAQTMPASSPAPAKEAQTAHAVPAAQTAQTAHAAPDTSGPQTAQAAPDTPTAPTEKQRKTQ